MFVEPIITSDIRPVWDGKRWIFCGKSYRSLRLLKSTNWFKIEYLIEKTLKKEILREFDSIILEMIMESEEALKSEGSEIDV